MLREGIKEGNLAVTGGRVWYRVVGAGKSGIPLLILHGGPGATHDYLEPLAALAQERPIVFYDQLGGGLAPAGPMTPLSGPRPGLWRNWPQCAGTWDWNRSISWANPGAPCWRWIIFSPAGPRG